MLRPSQILRVLGCFLQRNTLVADQRNLAGFHILITGGSSGIGEQIAKTLAEWGAEIIIACRSCEKGEQIAHSIHTQYGKDNVKILDDADTADLESMCRLSSRVISFLDGVPLDGLILNAGIAGRPFTLSNQGYELHAATNILGHHLLTRLLLPHLARSRDGRVVHLTGDIYAISNNCTLDYSYRFDKMGAYARSKLGVLWNAFTLHEKRAQLNALTVKSIAVHPGVVASNLIPGLDRLKNRLFISPWLGAQTSLIAMSSIDISSGSYLHNTRGIVQLNTSDPARNDHRRVEFWKECEHVIAPFMPTS